MHPQATRRWRAERWPRGRHIEIVARPRGPGRRRGALLKFLPQTPVLVPRPRIRANDGAPHSHRGLAAGPRRPGRTNRSGTDAVTSVPLLHQLSRLVASERISALSKASTRLARRKVWVIPIIRLGLTKLEQCLFGDLDEQARHDGWQVTRLHHGFGRRYRDPRFDLLSVCPDCVRQRQYRRPTMRAVPRYWPGHPGQAAHSRRPKAPAMPRNRAQRRNQAHLLADLERVLRPGRRATVLGYAWWWRYEIGIVLGLGIGLYALASALGIGQAVLGREHLQRWCLGRGQRRRGCSPPRPGAIITPHRLRAGCVQARIHSRNGRLPDHPAHQPAAIRRTGSGLVPGGHVAWRTSARRTASSPPRAGRHDITRHQ